MTLHHGFELLREAHLAEISSLVRHYRHAATGAELISVINDDDNKSFGVAFKTPAPDDTPPCARRRTTPPACPTSWNTRCWRAAANTP